MGDSLFERKVNEDNYQEFLKQEDSESFEFKKSIPNSLFDIDKLISAFANTKGGLLIIEYISDDSRSKSKSGKSLSDLDDYMSSHFEEKSDKILAKTNDGGFINAFKKICNCYKVSIQNGLLYVVEIVKSDVIIYSKQTAYIRIDKYEIAVAGKGCSKLLDKFVYYITYENRNPVNEGDLQSISGIKDSSTNSVIELKTGTCLYRSRLIKDKRKIKDKSPYYGFDEKESLMPPVEVTLAQRANYQCIPHLYCASKPYVTLLELQPSNGDLINLAELKVNQDIKLLDLTFIDSTFGKIKLSKINLLASLSLRFSEPTSSKDNPIEYIPTQFIADYVKKMKLYDGIAYRSSHYEKLNHNYMTACGYNIVLFKQEKISLSLTNVIRINRKFGKQLIVENHQKDKGKDCIMIDNPNKTS